MRANEHADCVGRKMEGFRGSAAARRKKFGEASRDCAGKHRTRSGKRRKSAKRR